MGAKAKAEGKLPPESLDAERGRQNHKLLEAGFGPENIQRRIDAILRAAREAGSEVRKEYRFFIVDHGLRTLFSAKPDMVIINASVVDFYDWKPAQHEDWDAWESQIEADAVTLHDSFPTSHLRGWIVTEHFGERCYEFNQERFELLRKELECVIDAHVRQPDANVVPVAGSWCRYCEGRLICPAVRELALRPPDVVSDALPRGEKGATIVAKLKQGIRVAYEILDWYHAALENDPEYLDGKWHLKAGARVTSVTDQAAAVARLINSLSVEEILSCSELSLPRLKDKWRQIYGVRRAEADIQITSILDGLIEEKRKKSSLVRGK